MLIQAYNQMSPSETLGLTAVLRTYKNAMRVINTSLHFRVICFILRDNEKKPVTYGSVEATLL